MIKRILVPLDGSRLSEQALPLASTLAAKFGAELLIAHSTATGQHIEEDDNLGLLNEAGRLAGEQYLAATEQELSAKGLTVRSTLTRGRPHIAIARTCDLEGIDLVVMTTHGRSGVSRWTMGSVADKVLRTTSTPLILIHPTEHRAPISAIERIVVPLDGSELAEAALPYAEVLAKTLHTEMHLVRVIVPAAVLYAEEYLPGMLPVLEEMEADAREYLAHVSKRLRSKGLKVTAEFRTGVPAHEVLEEACQPTDMVVMSTHGRSGVDRWFLGSVADAVVRHGNIPVLVVRSWVTLAEPAEEEQDAEPTQTLGEQPLIVTGIPPVIPVPVMHEHQEAVAASHGKPARRQHRPEARGRELR
ncbi:MAG: universal stress protein [Chloroflexota bacterium]